MDEQPYDERFFELIAEPARASAQVVVPLLLERLEVRSVVDVGCGSGGWLRVFLDNGITDVTGVDGAHVPTSTLEIAATRFLPRDLTRSLRLPRRYDLALCLEVAEHLPPERGRSLVQDLVSLAPVVCFSAAVPHQGGTGHVNEQWPDHWSGLFADEGYDVVDCLRAQLWDDPDVAWWYAQNILLFVSRQEHDVLERFRGHGTISPAPLRLVHPARYLDWVQYGLTESQARW